MVVDQFEELFRFRARPVKPAAPATKRWLSSSCCWKPRSRTSIPIYVVVTMRSDFIGECMEFPGLPETINIGQYLVSRMTRDELRSAITGPVAVGGAEIAPRLGSPAAERSGQRPRSIARAPARAHAHLGPLAAPVRPGKVAPIDVSDYEAIGTMRQALSLHAEEAYQETGSAPGSADCRADVQGSDGHFFGSAWHPASHLRKETLGHLRSVRAGSDPDQSRSSGGPAEVF